MDHPKLVFAVLATICSLSQYSSAQELIAVKSNATFPSATALAASFYDGNDTIYVFGGVGVNFPPLHPQAFKYSISVDTLTPTAGQPPIGSMGGGIVKDNAGNMYHLAGNVFNVDDPDIFQFFPETESFSSVSNLYLATDVFGLIQPDEDTALIIGGYDFAGTNMIQRLNLRDLKSEKLADLPKSGPYYTSAIWVEEQGAAFIFDGREGFTNVTKFHLATNQSELLPNYFPTMEGATQALYDGRYGYIIGGYGPDMPFDNIMQFDPTTGDFQFVRVLNWPGWAYLYFHATSAVYVEKLNRVYMFGGHTYNTDDMFFDNIWYFSLDPVNSNKRS